MSVWFAMDAHFCHNPQRLASIFVWLFGFGDGFGYGFGNWFLNGLLMQHFWILKAGPYIWLRRRVDIFPWAVGLSVQWFARGLGLSDIKHDLLCLHCDDALQTWSSDECVIGFWLMVTVFCCYVATKVINSIGLLRVIMARIIQWIIDWIFGRKIGRIIDRIIEWIIRKCDRGLTFGLPPDPEEINYPF